MTEKPIRLRLSRKRGFRLQEVSRAANGLPAKACVRPSVWGNRYRVGIDGTQAECVTKHMLQAKRWPRERFEELRGFNLACSCALDEDCHVDNLLELANRDDCPFAPTSY